MSASDVLIVGPARTPIGQYGGAFRDLGLEWFEQSQPITQSADHRIRECV
jgi:hypothetical protein